MPAQLKHRLRLFECKDVDDNPRVRMRADQRVGRQNVATTIVERVAEGATVPGVPFTERASCKSVTAKLGTRNWKEHYVERCEQDRVERQAERARLDHLRCTYRPEVRDFAHLYDHGDIPHLQVPEPWLKIWKRNIYCEQCLARTTPGVGRVECLTCPVVQHVKCTHFNAFERAEASRSEASDANRSTDGLHRHHWRCAECLEYMADAVVKHRHAVRQKKMHRNAARYIVQLQCWSRMVGARIRHRKAKWAAELVQAQLRGKQVRRGFHAMFGPTLYRPYRITVSDATGLAIPSRWAGKLVEVYAVCTVVRSEEDMYRDVIANQVARVDVQPRLLDFKHSRVKFDETVLCNGSTSQAVLAVTVLAVPKNPSEPFDPLATPTFEFLGQAELSLEDAVLYSKRTLATLKLGPCIHEVHDQHSQKAQRMLHLDRPVTGQVSVAVKPCSHWFTNCGYIHEIPAGETLRETKKRWWAVLVNAHLYISNRPTDAKPRFTLPLKDAHLKLHKSSQGYSLEIRGADFFHVFCCDSDHDVSKWYNKCNTARTHEAQRKQWKHLSLLQTMGVFGGSKEHEVDRRGSASTKAQAPAPVRKRRTALVSSNIGLIG